MGQSLTEEWGLEWPAGLVSPRAHLVTIQFTFTLIRSMSLAIAIFVKMNSLTVDRHQKYSDMFNMTYWLFFS